MRLLERVLLVIGLTCLGYYGLAAADAAYTQYEARVAVEQLIARAEKPLDPLVPLANGVTPAPTFGDHLVGLLEIPRLGVSTPIVEGDDTAALKGAAGHLPDTPRPWEHGNSAIAAHRDGLFRPLKDVRIGDRVRVMTPRGKLTYQVKGTRVVKSTDLSVLKPTKKQALTLITCYPFYYVGAAPKRFVVYAERILSNEERRTKRKRLQS